MHARGVPEWFGHLPIEAVVGFWYVSVGAAFRFGAGVPVRLAGGPLGLLLEPRCSMGAPVLIDWRDFASVRRCPRTRMTAWGRMGLLPFDVVRIELTDGLVLPFATHDASGLADLITGQGGDRPGTLRG
ncbi:hypothetical protein [Dactylosporangium sp. NPDC000521]|uniref:hypothetical protein n=1 Tax=Dactylosporangium sp. NPDC000521 TaxID=3363975 RepID=UPI0036BE26BC